MRFIQELPFPILIVIAALMLGAPFVPEPHLVEKARMAMNGTLTRPIDIFDVLWHLLPTALLVWKTVLWRRACATGKEASSAASGKRNTDGSFTAMNSGRGSSRPDPKRE